jgi:hypothetical protein
LSLHLFSFHLDVWDLIAFGFKVPTLFVRNAI